MRYLVTGVNGQLGHDVMMELNSRGEREILGTGRSEEYSGICDDYVDLELPYEQLDFCSEAAVRRVFEEFRPEQVIHCASWTKVDAAEWQENRNYVLMSNVVGTAILAKACRECGASMTYISTDYVFGSEEKDKIAERFPRIPHNLFLECDKFIKDLLAEENVCDHHACCSEGYFGAYHDLDWVDELPSPNFYGRTKLAGELIVSRMLERHYIVRVSWSFGVNGTNFVKTMLRLAKNKELKVVDDQIGRPTFTEDAAKRILDIVSGRLEYGLYHAVNSGEFISWYEFAGEIFDIVGSDVKLESVTSDEYESSFKCEPNKPRAIRPANSRIVCERAEAQGLPAMQDWKKALKKYIIMIEQNNRS